MTDKKQTANKHRSRKYQLTFNNPVEHGYTHEAIKKALSKWENIVYFCMADEIGEQGTFHTHLFFQAKNPLYFDSVHKTFYGVHIEIAQGSAEDNRAYIRKEGKWENTEKEQTRVQNSFEEYGIMPLAGQGRRTDLANLYQMIKDGYSNTEILENNSDNILYLQHIDKARLEIQNQKYKSERRLDLLVTYVYGKTGCGKSRDILDTHGDANVYRATDYSHPFDTYRGEDVLVLEEYRSNLQAGDLLNYLDVYPIQLPARYNNRQAAYHFVYIVSNIPLTDQYKNIQIEQPETYAALLRRIKKVKVYTAPNEWQEYDTEDYMNNFHPITDKTPFETK